jgi:hypothetical protein
VTAVQRVFVLSPARLDGIRARALLAPKSPPARWSPLVRALRTREGVPIGDVFRFLSGLYFRGKITYASRFAVGPPPPSWAAGGVFVITANRGLLPVESRVCLEHLEAFAETDIHQDEERFVGPLVRDAGLLRDALEPSAQVVLLGSVARAKYTEPLLSIFEERLLFPEAFVGRGDMSRGGLLLRAEASRAELAYVPVKGASVHGARPPKLGRR